MVCYLFPFLCLFQDDQPKPGQPGQAPRPAGAGVPARVQKKPLYGFYEQYVGVFTVALLQFGRFLWGWK